MLLIVTFYLTWSAAFRDLLSFPTRRSSDLQFTVMSADEVLSAVAAGASDSFVASTVAGLGSVPQTAASVVPEIFTVCELGVTIVPNEQASVPAVIAHGGETIVP